MFLRYIGSPKAASQSILFGQLAQAAAAELTGHNHHTRALPHSTTCWRARMIAACAATTAGGVAFWGEISLQCCVRRAPSVSVGQACGSVHSVGLYKVEHIRGCCSCPPRGQQAPPVHTPAPLAAMDPAGQLPAKPQLTAQGGVTGALLSDALQPFSSKAEAKNNQAHAHTTLSPQKDT